MPPLAYQYFHDTFKKGRGIAAYSGFDGVGALSRLTLHEYLASNDIEAVDLCGIALDYCVRHTALDARNIGRGFQPRILVDLTVSIKPMRGVVNELVAAGVPVFDSSKMKW